MIRLKVFVAALGVLAILGTAVPAQAHEEKTGDITIVHPWSRPAAQGHNGVIYLGIENRGAADDRLVAVSTPLATKVEFHQSTMEEGIHRMEQVESIVVPAGGTVELAPGGLHIMLIGLKAPLVAGESFPMTLVFVRGGRIEVEVKIEEATRTDAPSGQEHDHGS